MIDEQQQQQQQTLTHHHGGFLKTDRGRVMIFIDGSNLFFTQQLMGFDIDYVRLVETLVGTNDLIRVFFYAGIDMQTNQSTAWQFFMRKKGFKLVTKPLATLPDGSKKANLDVEMAVDMVLLKDSYDTAVVLTGDGDLAYAVNKVVGFGKQVEVVGSKLNTNSSLIEAADRFIDLEGQRANIIKRQN